MVRSALRAVLVMAMLCSVAFESAFTVRARRADGLVHGFTTTKSRASELHLTLPRLLAARLVRESAPFSHRVSLSSARGRREASDEKCGLPGSKVLEHQAQELSETAESIQAIWLGRDEILIIASDTSKTTVWIGHKKSYGIFTFTPDTAAIGQPVAPSSLQSSVADRRMVVVVSSSHKHLFVSHDAGHTWDRHILPLILFNPNEDLILSNRDPRVMVLDTRANELFVTYNGGVSWSRLAQHANRVQLAFSSDGNREYLYYSTGLPRANFNPLYRMDLSSREVHVLDHATYRFKVDNKYLFVSRQNSTGNVQRDKQTRRLYVSQDHGSLNGAGILFTEVQLPSLLPEQYYVIMATHESGAFIHVATNLGQPSGSLYVSNSAGYRYSLSLANHMYQVIDLGAAGTITVDDFYEVESIRGVYITTAVEDLPPGTLPPSTNSHVTMITFNNGADWNRLTPPTTHRCTGSVCSLHLHLHYSRLAMVLNASVSSPLSVASAPGIIIAHGSIGASLNLSESRLVISSDGGYSWKTPTNLPQGSYVYGIADYGNIIAVVQNSEHTEFVWFSHNRGDCFVREQLDSTGAFLARGLVIDPSAASLYAFVMGVEGLGADDEWRMVTINFASLLDRKCTMKDYELVSEHKAAKTCLLGYQRQYNFTKQNSICFNEASYNFSAARVTRCECADTDFECDYGFNRTAAGSCSKDTKFSLSSVCPPGASFYSESISGLRLIPGDHCTETSDSRAKLKTQQLPCTAHEKEAGLPRGGSKSGPSAGQVIGGIMIAIAIIAAAAFCLYGYLKCRNRPNIRERVLYQRLPVTDTRFSATEDSESDEDLLDAS